MQKVSPAEAKIFLLAAVGISTAVWDVSFNLGVYGTVFYEKVFLIWVSSTVAFVASLFLLDLKSPLNRWPTRLALLAPSALMVLFFLEATAIESAAVDTTISVLSAVVGLVVLPYALYVIVLVITPDLVHLKSGRLLFGLVVIAAAVAVTAFLVGVNNQLFLTCDDFQVSGNDVPEDCTQ